MSDLIDRQAAIDRIEKHLRVGDELYPLTDTDKILNHAFEIAASCVYNLPSAQPEPIKINIDHELTKEEYEKIRKDLADAPIVLQPDRKPSEWLHEYLQTAVDFCIITETQASRLMDMIDDSEDNT